MGVSHTMVIKFHGFQYFVLERHTLTLFFNSYTTQIWAIKQFANPKNTYYITCFATALEKAVFFFTEN